MRSGPWSTGTSDAQHELDRDGHRHYNSRMKIVDLTNILRKETHIYYRREFKADAVFEIMQQIKSIPVEFVLEHKPTGAVDVSATIIDDIDYPVMPFVTELKLFIAALDKRGALP